jgi:competence protein ComEC
VVEELGEVLPFFFKEIDLLVLTHPHLDHVEGLISVLQHYQVKEVLMSAPSYENQAYEVFVNGLAEQGIPVHFAQADEDFRLGNLELDVLYPFKSVTGRHFENVNNVSVVIRASYGEDSILLTGDAEQEVEAELLESGVLSEVDVLKAGHHGSRSSSTEAFLDAVRPKFMVISCGKENQFHHPHLETLQKAAAREIQVFRTDIEGRVSLTFQELSWMRSILAPRLRSLASSPS